MDPNSAWALKKSTSEEKMQGRSSSPKPSHSVENELEDFRQKWQKELQISPAKGKRELETSSLATEENDSSDIEQKAKVLFLRGASMEKNGKLYEAIQFYRKAIQLVPDIEFKVGTSLRAPKNPSKFVKDNEEVELDDSDEEDGDLLSRVQSKLSGTSSICTPKTEQTSTHISALPFEIVLYILRWLVSSELDLRSLEMFGRVCRGFYLCARDSEIWRLACLKVWGVHSGKTPGNYGTWRQMFIDRARLKFNGCYISKTTYIRHGENSFQDQFYRPWHLVAYYRYFRFFPDGTVLMLTSADEPNQCVSQLRNKTRRPPVLYGYYRLKDDRVTLVVDRKDKSAGQFKRNRGNQQNESQEQSCHIELQIVNHRNGKHVKLQWIHYSIKSKMRNGVENTCVFDMVHKFAPLWFSRVKSYTVESESPLV